jgi:hypothetical protein
MNVSGIHTITLRFCRCIGVSHPHKQLLAATWFPVSINWPNITFTFDVLNTFQLINLQGKLSAYDFYNLLEHKTNNTRTLGIQAIIAPSQAPENDTVIWDQYHQFLTAIHIYHHIKMLKQAGCGQDLASVDTTQPGDCEVECLALVLPQL